MSSAASRPPNIASPSTSLSTGGPTVEPSSSQHAPSAVATAMASSAPSNPENNATTGTASSNSSTKPTSRLSQPAAANAGLRQPPRRSLMKPPARPKPPVPPEPSPTPVAVQEVPQTPQRPGPISLPSEPMQYRAIGLIKGKYIPSEEQFNRGDIAVEDGTLVDAVLLGRVTSLIKKHIDLEKAHLWVVYPRTLYKDVSSEEDDTVDGLDSDIAGEKAADDLQDDAGKAEDSSPTKKSPAPKSSEPKSQTSEEKVPALHVQIVGVWEPETLSAEADCDSEDERPLSSEEAAAQCDQFSVRGEIAKYSEDDGEILVNIVQKSKSETAKPKRPFKLLIKGKLSGRTTGYFWDLTVARQAGELVLVEGKPVAVVPPKKKPKGKKGSFRRRPASGGKPRSAAPKPKPKPKSASESASESTSEETSAASVASQPTAGDLPKEPSKEISEA